MLRGQRESALPPLFSSNSSFSTPPTSDQIEITIIGPGFGEAVLCHVGDGKWILVDSCMGTGDTVPTPLAYLDAIGVDHQQLMMIVVTHWDDDHCKGISKIVEACPDAQIVMSKAFVQKDFLSFVASYDSPLTQKVRSGVKELKEVASSIATRGKPIKGAFPNCRLVGPTEHKFSHGKTLEVFSLSPSEEEYDNFLLWTAEQMPNVDETRRVAVKRIRNDLSVVLHIKLGDDVILLGGDLEEEGKTTTGWSAILASGARPQEKAHLFKVSHHGSHNGHHDGILTDLLVEQPIAIVAPFKNGSVSLPTANDVKRISEYASKSYTTASLASRAPERKDATVEKIIKQVTHRYSAIKSDPGMIRLRKKAGESGDWSVEKFGDATELNKIF